MKLLFITLLLSLWFGACAAGTSSDRSGDQDGSVGNKPSDESEDLPGYLVDPGSLSVTESPDSSGEYVLDAPANSVVSSNYENTFVMVFGVNYGNSQNEFVEIALLAVSKVNDDGSFKILFNVSNYDSYFVQTIIGAPGKFEVKTNGTDLSNTVYFSDITSNLTPERYSDSPSVVESATQDTPPISLIYLNKVPQINSSEIEAQIEIHNPGNENYSLDGAEIRYYFDADGLTPNFEIDTATDILSANLEYGYDDGSKYIYFRISGDVSVAANDHRKIRFIVTNTQMSEFNQSNDPSFIATQTTKSLSKKINVYKDGAKIWGEI